MKELPELLILLSILFLINVVEAQKVIKQENSNATGENNKDHRIVGGSASSLGSLPWQGMFLTNGGGLCGCSLLDTQWVITAAHCTAGETSSTVNVYFNFIDTRLLVLADRYTISTIYDHSSYNPRTLENDISLLRINGLVSTSSNVQPITIPTQGVSTSVGTGCTISGWGTTSAGGSTSSVLLSATVPIVDSILCNSWYNTDGITIHSNQVCAGFQAGGIDTCQGDSGGPLACQDSSGVYVLQGLTSFGVGCAGVERPGVYTRVSEYNDWINGIMTGDGGQTLTGSARRRFSSRILIVSSVLIASIFKKML